MNNFENIRGINFCEFGKKPRNFLPLNTLSEKSWCTE